MVKRHERPRSRPGRSESRRGRRHRREGGADPRLQRDAARPQRQQADARRRAPRQRRQARALREAQRGGVLMEATATAQAQAAPPPRLRERYEQEVLPALIEQVRLLDADAGAAPARRSRSTWASARPSRTRRCSKPRRAAGDDRRPAAQRAPRPQVDRLLQGARGDAGRRLGDPAPGPDVGVPRPPLLDRGAADPRLPRPQPALLRRPRQLLDGRPRAADLPRNRLRLDRRGARPRRDDHDHARRPTRRPSSCCSALGMPFAKEGRPGGRADVEAQEAAEEEKRKEEARQRAEAEQAALEQLKEENPEAYAKPEPRRRQARRARRRRGRRATAESDAPSEENQENG